RYLTANQGAILEMPAEEFDPAMIDPLLGGQPAEWPRVLAGVILPPKPKKKDDDFVPVGDAVRVEAHIKDKDTGQFIFQENVSGRVYCIRMLSKGDRIKSLHVDTPGTKCDAEGYAVGEETAFTFALHQLQPDPDKGQIWSAFPVTMASQPSLYVRRT